MKNYTAIILESNVAVAEQLKSGLEERGFVVSYCGDDGDEGVQLILKEKPDVIVTGMFLKGTDGCELIRLAKKTWQDVKIMATGLPNDELIERAMSLGATYYLVKPFSVELAVERIGELLKERVSGYREYPFSKRKPSSLEEKISEIFIAIGIPPNIKGYTYMREGIKMTVERPYIINSVTKELYPSIAKKFATTPSKVERAVRHAIEVAWNRGRIEAINAIFGARIYLGQEKPTNSEFIALVADKLILEGMG